MTTMRDRMQRLGVRLKPGSGGFFAWWGQALASWLPLRWRVLLGLTRERLLLSAHGEDLLLQWQHAGGLRDVARVPLPLQPRELETLLDSRLAALPRWWLLPAASALRRPLLLPAAAAERLRDVVGFEIDRQTPFSADGARFDARILRRREDGQLEAELVVVPRARFDADLQAMGGLAEGLAGVDLAAADGQPLDVNLLPPQSRQRRQAPQRQWQVLLAAIALLAVMAAAWRLLDNRRAAADAFAARIEAQAPAAREAATQRQQLVNLVEGAVTLDQARASRPTTVEVLDEVTRRLPDTTYLEKLSIEGTRLTLIGLSPEASGLVGKLQGSRFWRSPALSGALQPDARSRIDRFTLTAELIAPTQAPAVEAAPAAPAGDADGAVAR
jgi:general secretion pathway protein L